MLKCKMKKHANLTEKRDRNTGYEQNIVVDYVLAAL